MAKPKPPWAVYENYDLGELNPLDDNIFDFTSYDQGKDIFASYSEIHRKNFSHDLLSNKAGPYLAVVLKVLSGPQVNNEAATNGGNLTKSISLNNYKSALSEEKEKANKPQPLKVIARVPEIDSDIDWPEDEEDEARLAAHGEFHQMREDKLLEQVVPGSLIWVEYHSLNNTTGYHGGPAGKIVALHEPGNFAHMETEDSSEEGFNPPCKSLRNLTAPGGGIYIGHTEPDPVLFMGPPIRKFKGRIKTGLFGNGTQQTKQYFDECLRLATPSAKHNIPGAAPNSSNAFIWVGHLKNNGYLDVIDRPLNLGRETIIYAPGTLDLNSEIELKFYFHDRGGFGYPWITGPLTSVEAAIQHATTIKDNDFKEKVAPGIKDLIRDGRNFILVIPEMSYSRGFGTVGSARTREIMNGEEVANGILGYRKTTSRTFMDPQVREMMKNYLKNMPSSAGENLSEVNHLYNRQFATFDGTFSGGDFGKFYDEVVTVLGRHFPNISDKIEYASILAEGMGGVALAAMAKDITTNASHVVARQSFMSVSEVRRIDFVDTGYDTAGFDPFFDNKSPSRTLYTDYIMHKPVDSVFEFNYITEYAPSNQNVNQFFDELNRIDLYKKHNKQVGGLGERKFSFNFEEGVNSFVSFHVTAKDKANLKGKVGYAFSMLNDYSGDIARRKSDSDNSQSRSFDSVPDHAEACTKSQAAADAAKIQKKISQLNESINYFETFLTNVIQNGSQAYCRDEGNPDNPNLRIYCDANGGLVTNKTSQFFSDYTRYLTSKKDLAELTIISNFEQQLLSHSLYKPRLEKFKTDLDEMLAAAKKTQKLVSGSWNDLYKRFDFNTFGTVQFVNGDANVDGTLNQYAQTMAAADAYEKIKLKVENTIEKISSKAVSLDPECAPPPIKLGDMIAPKPVDTPEAFNAVGAADCAGIQVSVPNNFDQIYEMIPYLPDKKRFVISGRSSKIPTKLDTINTYEIKSFDFQHRAASGQTTNSKSPPIWSCITDRVSSAWSSACGISNYVPFSIVRGIRGYGNFKGNTAYRFGMSLHAFGLAIDVDPFITGYSRDGSPLYSVYTGAWSAAFLSQHAQELYDLGVFKTRPSTLSNNAFEASNVLRMAENWEQAPNAYKGGGESGGQREIYKKIMRAAAGGPIVPPGANPTLWLITFCETSGMRWGNAKFMKKRWRGGSRWSEAEQKRISEIYNIPNIVKRIKAISWTTTSVEDHMHFHFWSGRSLVPWSQIAATKKRIG